LNLGSKMCFKKIKFQKTGKNFVNIRYFCINRLKKMHLSDSVILNDVLVLTFS